MKSRFCRAFKLAKISNAKNVTIKHMQHYGTHQFDVSNSIRRIVYLKLFVSPFFCENVQCSLYPVAHICTYLHIKRAPTHITLNVKCSGSQFDLAQKVHVTVEVPRRLQTNTLNLKNGWQRIEKSNLIVAECLLLS